MHLDRAPNEQGELIGVNIAQMKGTFFKRGGQKEVTPSENKQSSKIDVIKAGDIVQYNYMWKNPVDTAPRKKIILMKYFKPWNWVISVGLYEDEFFNRLNDMRNYILLGLFFFSILSFWIAQLFISKQLGQPVSHLIGVMREIQSGNLNVRAEIDTGDELGELAEKFNEMSQWLRLSYRDIDMKNKEIKKYSEHLQDMVEHKTSQLQIAIREAEEANKIKSRFIANMSHEMRTPMNAILGFSEILSEKEANEQKKYYLNSIFSCGKNLLGLINEVLDLSKVEAGKLSVEYSPVSIKEIFNAMKNMFEITINEKKLKFMVELPEELPRKILTDERRLRQILINLIGNAVKFTQKGFIKLSADFIYKDGTAKNTIDLRLSVQDTGPGIPEKEQESVFEAFTQLKGQKDSPMGGTGLGLTITMGLTELMGGEIHVESQLGVGTTFIVLFKDMEVLKGSFLKAYDEGELNYKQFEFNPGLHIILADDIQYNRELIKGYLENYGFIITEAENGKQALDKIKEKHPDIALLDMKMPVMDGYELAQIMKADEKLKNIPLVAITASVMKDQEEKLSNICDFFIRKPVSKKN